MAKVKGTDGAERGRKPTPVLIGVTYSSSCDLSTLSRLNFDLCLWKLPADILPAGKLQQIPTLND